MAARQMNRAPRNASITSTQSTTLVKNLLSAAFSSIAYIRNYFEEDCFEISKIGTIRYHKIVDKRPAEVRQYTEWLELGAFDAIQKQYLDVILLEVFARVPSNPTGTGNAKSQAGRKGELLECFSFSINYEKDGAQLQLSGKGSSGATSCPTGTKEEIKKNTRQLLRSLVELTQTLEPLPKNRILSMTLLYKPDTPAEYEPPLFSKASDEDGCWFEERPIRVKAGVLTTPYHQLSMTIRARATPENTAAKVLEKREAEPAETEQPSQMTIVDVGGGSQGNSGRVGLARPPLRESQDVGQSKKNATMSERRMKIQPLKLRVRPMEGSQMIGAGSARRGDGNTRVKEGTKVASVRTGLNGKRKRKASKAAVREEDGVAHGI